MKLKIKQKYLDEIKTGNKNIEWRDAHLTLISEETGEQVRVEVVDVGIVPKNEVPKEYVHLFDDHLVLGFNTQIKARFIGKTAVAGNYKDRWECINCKETGKAESKFNLHENKRNSMHKCRFCGCMIFLEAEK